MLNKKWSVDSWFGNVLFHKRFVRFEMVCAKTLYNYINLGLVCVKNIDLPKVKRNTKPRLVRVNKINLGRSIEERPSEIENRKEFGYWEIDTVIGKKSKGNESFYSL